MLTIQTLCTKLPQSPVTPSKVRRANTRDQAEAFHREPSEVRSSGTLRLQVLGTLQIPTT